MNKIELDKLLEEKTPNQILSKYMLSEINLTERQLEKVIKLKKGTPEEGHCGVNVKGILWERKND